MVGDDDVVGGIVKDGEVDEVCVVVISEDGGIDDDNDVADNIDSADTGKDEEDFVDGVEDEDDDAGLTVGEDDDCGEDVEVGTENCWNAGKCVEAVDAVCESIDGTDVEFGGEAGNMEWCGGKNPSVTESDAVCFIIEKGLNSSRFWFGYYYKFCKIFLCKAQKTTKKKYIHQYFCTSRHFLSCTAL